ncbi:MAG TPA: hypothetical protein VHR72_09910 [Gemmataceae bacterium]|jgi:hypothetical protein|nr:hypothetical protein [Gemmataceae bacterium]
MSVLRCSSCNLPMTGDEVSRGACPSCGAAVDAEKRSVEEAITAPIWTPDPSHSKYPAPKRTEDDREVATVVLQGRNQRVTMPLPHVCVRCGNPSDTFVEKKFAWWPAWAYFPPIIAMFMTKRMSVKLPVCNRHRNPWLANQLFAVAMLVYLIVGPFVAIFVSAQAENDLGRGNPVSIGVLIGWFVGMIVFMVLLIPMRRRTILPRRITADEITLWGVCRNFADRVGRQSHIH